RRAEALARRTPPSKNHERAVPSRGQALRPTGAADRGGAHYRGNTGPDVTVTISRPRRGALSGVDSTGLGTLVRDRPIVVDRVPRSRESPERRRPRSIVSR